MIFALKLLACLIIATALVWNYRSLVNYLLRPYENFSYHLQGTPKQLHTAFKAHCMSSGWQSFKAIFKASWHDRCSGFLLKSETEIELVLQPLLGGRNSMRPNLILTFQEDFSPNHCHLIGEFQIVSQTFFKLFFGGWHITLGMVMVLILLSPNLTGNIRLTSLFVPCLMAIAPWLTVVLCRLGAERQIEQVRAYLEDLLYNLENQGEAQP